MSTLNFKDWIEIVIAFVTALVSVVSIVIAVQSLRLTRKSIEDANKPYLYCYVAYSAVGFFEKYFILKNAGKTPAYIRDITFINSENVFKNEVEPTSLRGSLVAPGQQFITKINTDCKDLFQVEIEFIDLNKNIEKQTFTLNSALSSKLSYSKHSNTKFSVFENEYINIKHEMHKNNL